MSTVAPAMGSARLRPDLTDTLIEADNEILSEQGFVAEQVLPVAEVDEQTADFYRLNLEDFLGYGENLKRAPGAAYQEMDFLTEQDSYATQEYGITGKLDERQAKIYKSYFDAEVETTKMIRHRLLLAYEKRVADLTTNTANVGGNAAAGTVWTDEANSTIFDDVKTGILAGRDQCGLPLDSMLVTLDRFLDMIDNDELLSRIKYSGRDDPKRNQLTPQVVADALGLKQIIVAGMNGKVRNTANEGQSASLDNIWPDDKALLFRSAANSNGVLSRALGRTFHWKRDGSSAKGTVESYFVDDIRATKIRVRHDVDEKIYYPEAGYIITGIAA